MSPAPLTTEANGEVLEHHIQDIIQAAAIHDLSRLEKCINDYSFPECRAADVQDPATGASPLHATVSSCKTGVEGGESGISTKQDEALPIVSLLLENGAIWNQLDNNDETPGCIAYRLGLHDLYQVLVDAGVRAEMLLSRLEEYEMLEDDADGEETTEGETNESEAPRGGNGEGEPAGLQEDVNSSTYLSSALSLGGSRLLDEQQNGVMMSWENDIMLQSADALLSEPGLRILNIGFGMGIIDSHIQNHHCKPSSHHIVEAHPDVLSEMERKGWMAKPNVVVHRGKWQDILPQLTAQGEDFDAIYFDTFAESYSEFRQFFSEQVIGLLSQGGKWSFFNGMGADRQISYDVYQKVVELDLFESGFDVEWTDVALPDLEGEWEGVRRKYWNIAGYRLPVCKFMD